MPQKLLTQVPLIMWMYTYDNILWTNFNFLIVIIYTLLIGWLLNEFIIIIIKFNIK